jgi:hypothetical protein
MTPSGRPVLEPLRQLGDLLGGRAVEQDPGHGIRVMRVRRFGVRAGRLGCE